MEHLIDIPGRLHSVAVEKHIAGTDQIYDDILKTTQDILNLENITDVKVQDGKLQFLNIQGQVLKEISIASEQKQSDWNQTDSTQVDFIKNRPTVYNKQEVDNKLTTKQDIIDDLATIRSGAQAGATAYHKPQTGIPATDLASVVQTSLSKADTALQEHQSLVGLVNTGNYNTVSKKIELKHDNTVLAEIDATTFIKDGMVSSVTINNGYLIITFNTDAGKEPISIALTDIFNPANYYDKIAVDNLLANKVDKENGKGLSTNDYTTDDKNKLNALPTNNALTTILNGKVNTDDLNEYVPKTYADGHGNQSIYSPAGISMFAADEHGIVNSTGTFGAGGWYVSSPQGTFQTSANTIYRGTLGIDEDSVVWEKTATQQIPAATAEKNGLMTAEDKSKLNALPTATELAQELGGKADSADLAEVATSGSYNDLSDKPTIPAAQVQSDWNEGDTTSKAYIKNKPTIPTVPSNVSAFNNDAGYLTEHQNITGKADKVSNPTEGNFAALDSNGNLIDSGHKHSDYLTEHQSLNNYVQKSNTQGLLKNDGTIDTTQYLTQHQDISEKANKNEMNVVPGTGVDVDKTTITLKQGMSATVLTTHQDITGKENTMPITTATGETLTAVVGNYYRLDNVGILAITLPTIVGATKLQAITFMIACGSSALVTFAPQDSETILYQEDFALESDTTYEVTALWNGSEWTLSRVIYE